MKKYINLELVDDIELQQIIATTSQPIKTKKQSSLVKMLANTDPKNGTEFFDQIEKYYDKNGDNVQMILNSFHHLCQSQVDST